MNDIAQLKAQQAILRDLDAYLTRPDERAQFGLSKKSTS